MCWHESVRLRRDGGEDAFLMKTQAIGASSVRRRVEAVASYLDGVRRTRRSSETF